MPRHDSGTASDTMEAHRIELEIPSTPIAVEVVCSP